MHCACTLCMQLARQCVCAAYALCTGCVNACTMCPLTAHSRLRMRHAAPTLWPPPAAPKLHLERCSRMLHHDQVRTHTMHTPRDYYAHLAPCACLAYALHMARTRTCTRTRTRTCACHVSRRLGAAAARGPAQLPRHAVHVRVDHDARAVAVGLAEGHAQHQVCNLGPDARPAYAYMHICICIYDA